MFDLKNWFFLLSVMCLSHGKWLKEEKQLEKEGKESSFYPVFDDQFINAGKCIVFITLPVTINILLFDSEFWTSSTGSRLILCILCKLHKRTTFLIWPSTFTNPRVLITKQNKNYLIYIDCTFFRQIYWNFLHLRYTKVYWNSNIWNNILKLI